MVKSLGNLTGCTVTFNLIDLSPADLTYLEQCVTAGRVLRRSKSKLTQFARRWLSRYASEHDGVVYLKKTQRLRYREDDVE